ncbi:hypothetical protein NFJ02_06g125420 [Pycnococcus provasolii]
MAKVMYRAEQSSAPTPPADTRKRKHATDDVVAQHCEDGVSIAKTYTRDIVKLRKVDCCKWCAGDFTIRYSSQKPIRNTCEGRVVCAPCLQHVKNNERRGTLGKLPPLACCIKTKHLSKVLQVPMPGGRKGEKKYELKPILRKGEAVNGNDAHYYAKLHDL